MSSVFYEQKILPLTLKASAPHMQDARDAFIHAFFADLLLCSFKQLYALDMCCYL